MAVRGRMPITPCQSWAEIDHDFGRAPVRLAVTLAETPQLVLPQDRCSADSISGIDAIRMDGRYAAWT